MNTHAILSAGATLSSIGLISWKLETRWSTLFKFIYYYSLNNIFGKSNEGKSIGFSRHLLLE